MHDEAPLPVSTTPSPPRGLKTAGVVAVIVAAGVVATGALTRAHDVQAATTWSDARAIPTVHLVPVSASAKSDTLSLPGTMQAWTAAKLYARVGGYVKGWYRDIGAVVPAGAALGAIDTPELDQQIAQARADVTSARAHASLAHSTAARWNDLLTTASVSRQEVDEKNGDVAVRNAAVQAATAALARLEALKTFAVVRAPFAGVVTNRSADIGDLVGPGSASTQPPLFSIADTRRIRIYVSVPQVYSAAMTPGLVATLSVPGFPGKSISARVIGNSGAVDSQTGTFQVQLVADNVQNLLKPGGFAEVRFDVPSQAGVLVVPSSVLLFRAQGSQVATVDAGGHIQLRNIKIGRDFGQTVEVLSGLTATDHVVDNPPDSLAQGELVRTGSASHG